MCRSTRHAGVLVIGIRAATGPRIGPTALRVGARALPGGVICFVTTIKIGMMSVAQVCRQGAHAGLRFFTTSGGLHHRCLGGAALGNMNQLVFEQVRVTFYAARVDARDTAAHGTGATPRRSSCMIGVQ